MDFETPAATFDEPATFNIDGATVQLTCSWCPEQYDVYKGKHRIGYLRLRHGWFRADYPDCGGDTVYEAQPVGDGAFIDAAERERHLRAAVRALRDVHKREAQ